MNKYKLRHRMLEEVYKAPTIPINEKYSNWIKDSELKERIKGCYSKSNFYIQLEYLHSKKEIIKSKYTDGSININIDKLGVEAYLDNFYLYKSRDEKRNSIQHYLKVSAWSIGIFLGTATFILNLYKLSQDIYTVPLIEYRLQSLENHINQQETAKTSTIPNSKDSL